MVGQVGSFICVQDKFESMAKWLAMRSGATNGGALSKKSEPIFAQTGAAAEKPSGWGSRRACRTKPKRRLAIGNPAGRCRTISNCSLTVMLFGSV